MPSRKHGDNRAPYSSAGCYECFRHGLYLNITRLNVQRTSMVEVDVELGM